MWPVIYHMLFATPARAAVWPRGGGAGLVTRNRLAKVRQIASCGGPRTCMWPIICCCHARMWVARPMMQRTGLPAHPPPGTCKPCTTPGGLC